MVGLDSEPQIFATPFSGSQTAKNPKLSFHTVHATEASIRPRGSSTCTASLRVASKPPYSRGVNSRKTPDARSVATSSWGNLR